MKELKIGGVSIKWLGHSAFEIDYTKKIYIDPYNINTAKNDADIILISHEHSDHFSPEDIKKLANRETAIILTPDCLSKLSRFDILGKSFTIRPGNKVKIGEKILVEAVPAYNINKFKAPGLLYHPKENDWVGYLIDFDNVKVYFAGDTDFVPELRNLKADVAIVPLSCSNIMITDEAAEFVNSIKPRFAIPMHYGTKVGTTEDAEKLKKLSRPEVVILEKS